MNLKFLVVGLIIFLSTAATCAETFEKAGISYSYITYEDMDPLVEILANKIKDSEHVFTGIVIITRGGLHAANLLARKLKIKIFEIIGLESYGEDNSQKQIRVLKPLELKDGGKNWLIVDDLSDTGDTLRYMQTHFPNAMRACLYVKPKGKDMAHFYAVEVKQNNWLTFAYEKTYEEFLNLKQNK